MFTHMSVYTQVYTHVYTMSTRMCVRMPTDTPAHMPTHMSTHMSMIMSIHLDLFDMGQPCLLLGCDLHQRRRVAIRWLGAFSNDDVGLDIDEWVRLE